MTTAEKQLDTMAGKVTQIARKEGKETGLKLEGREEEWINISVIQYRGHWEMPTQGDHVRLGVSRSPKDNRLWASTCEIQGKAHSPQSTYDDGQVPAGGRDLSIMRQVCVKSAAEIVAALASRGFYQDSEEGYATVRIGMDTLALAQDFERWLIREDVKFE